MLTGLNFLEITRHQNRNRNECFREFCNRPLVLRTLIQYYNISRKKCFGEVRVFIWQVATSRKTIHFFWWFIFVQIFIIIQLKCPLEHYMPRLQRCALLYSSNLLTANMVYLCFLAAHYPLLQPSLVWGKKTPQNPWSWSFVFLKSVEFGGGLDYVTDGFQRCSTDLGLGWNMLLSQTVQERDYTSLRILSVNTRWTVLQI